MSPAAVILFLTTVIAGAGPVITLAGPQAEFVITLPGVSEISGLAWCRKDLYYGVSDTQPGIFPLHLTVDPASGLLTAARLEKPITVTSTLTDFEDIAWDPAGKGRIFVSTERPPSLAVFSLVGQSLPAPALPPVFLKARFNRGMEALTRDAATGHLWTASEDTLEPDGETSGMDRGGLVRLQEFNAAGQPARQFAWRTDVPGARRGGGSTGLTALCALPGGHLVVMERVIVGFHLEMRIYLAGFAEATDTSRINALAGAKFTPAHKTLLFTRNTGLTNFEGLAVGPVLQDGSRSLIAAADNGFGDSHTFLALRVTVP
jgi:hypothetical protein